MLKEAMQYFENVAKPEIFYEEDQTFSSRPLSKIFPLCIDALQIKTLTGLKDYVDHVGPQDGNPKGGTDWKFIHICSPFELRLVSQLGEQCGRDTFVRCVAPENRIGNVGRFIDIEEFVMMIQTQFVPNWATEALLKYVGNIQDGKVKTLADDGVTQSVTAKTSVVTVADVAFENPVRLRPYRTFSEIEQPQSSYVFRMAQGEGLPQCALLTVENGLWELMAIQGIKEWIKVNLPDMAVVG